MAGLLSSTSLAASLPVRSREQCRSASSSRPFAIRSAGARAIRNTLPARGGSSRRGGAQCSHGDTARDHPQDPIHTWVPLRRSAKHRANDWLETRSGWLGVLLCISTDGLILLTRVGNAPSTVAVASAAGGAARKQAGVRCIKHACMRRSDAAACCTRFCTIVFFHAHQTGTSALPRMRIGSVSSELLHNAPSGRTPPRIGDSTDKPQRWRRKSPCRFMAAEIICVDRIGLDAWPKITPWLPHLNCAPAVLSTATTRENRNGLD